MKAVFADTFYWVALSNSTDARYRDVLALENALAGAKIITTDEVLSEFLTFFAADAWLRNRASQTVQKLLRNQMVYVVPQSRQTFIRLGALSSAS